MKQFLTLILAILFCTNNIQAQQKGILLSNKKYEDTKFFGENKRVKIKTLDGKIHKGRIVIVDENTISIKNNLIPMNSITSIMSNSLFSKIIATTFVVIGSTTIIGGIIGGLAGGFAVLLIPPGIIITGIGIIIPAVGYIYVPKKWNFKIETNHIEQ